jgi:hypothetical protein
MECGRAKCHPEITMLQEVTAEGNIAFLHRTER